ncbi:MAG: T9SS type A sorting domain-containing protein [Bacteroidetes bacterium]|nr:T9SS type A sorting domain-containing protein [Bacteroidota bacterium]MBU1718020.1 T9SS type A sorting domain-containing protein [Bacteroidota bacterium]
MKSTSSISIWIMLVLTTLAAKGQQDNFSRVLYDATQYGIQLNSIVPAFDSGYVIAGERPWQAGLVIKLNEEGDVEWNRQISVSGYESKFNCITKTIDSCYVLGGNYGAGTEYHALCVKLTEDGDTIWTRAFGSSNMKITPTSAKQTLDSGYVMTGFVDSIGIFRRIFVTKFESNSNIEWSRVFSLSSSEASSFSIIPTLDSGYAIVGSVGYNSPLLMKISESGNFLWAKHFSFSTVYPGNGEDLVETDYGYVIRTGIGLIKTDSAGNVVWSTVFAQHPSYDYYEVSQKFFQSSDKGYLFVGGDCFGAEAIKLDTAGNVVWSMEIMLNPKEIIETFDNKYFIAGNGPMCGVKEYGYSPQIGYMLIDTLLSNLECAYNGYNSSVTVSTQAIPLDFSEETRLEETPVTMDFDSTSLYLRNGCIDINSNRTEIEQLDTKTFPNPVSDWLNIEFPQSPESTEISIFSIDGKLLLQRSTQEKSARIDFSAFSAGVYCLKIQSIKGSEFHLIIK